MFCVLDQSSSHRLFPFGCGILGYYVHPVALLLHDGWKDIIRLIYTMGNQCFVLVLPCYVSDGFAHCSLGVFMFVLDIHMRFFFFWYISCAIRELDNLLLIVDVLYIEFKWG